MRIKDKINLEYEGLCQHGAITVVAFGDSVTHGAVGDGEINYETVYWNRLKQKINETRNYVPVNVINSGIGGITAKASLDRMERDVFSHHPDLVIVCFGLNDVNGTLEDYLSSLETIFSECNKRGIETVFLSPNMLNTYVAEDTLEELKEYAKITAEMQNSGRMDSYIYSAVKLAESMNIKVCDCYSRWKELSKSRDITMLLANRINHPVKEMHQLFAEEIFEAIMK